MFSSKFVEEMQQEFFKKKKKNQRSKVLKVKEVDLALLLMFFDLKFVRDLGVHLFFKKRVMNKIKVLIHFRICF